MRWAALAVAVILSIGLPGCLSAFHKDKGPRGPQDVAPADVGYDPGTIRVTGVEKSNYTISSFDETNLATIVYAPVSGDKLPDGTPPHWGVVVFLHGWGDFKEQFQGVGGATDAPVPADPSGQAPYTTDRLDVFARNGLIAVAYDARGFGQSGGMATVAGPAELQDLDAVIDFVAAHYPTNGHVGVVGQSYGGGQAYQAWADDPRITTVVPQYGWVDLYEGLLQGNVPKAEWATLLLGLGGAGAHGQVSPMVAEWANKAATRTDLATVRDQMDLRSALPRMATVTKPLFVCQGMEETLFPQADQAWEHAGGFTRALVFTGGHGADNETCWSRSLDWFLYFLAGRDTGVKGWPALSTVDAMGGGLLDYHSFPQPTGQTFYLRAPSLANDPSNVSFTVAQRGVANPFAEPSGGWDVIGQPTNAVPEQFRQDPGAVFFDSPAFTGSEVLLGAPVAHLKLANAATAFPYQVTGVLYHVDSKGKSQIISRSAAAALSADDLDNGALDLRFWWTKADLAPGDKIVLKLGANDEGVWLPLMSPYTVSFTGSSTLDLPFFEG